MALEDENLDTLRGLASEHDIEGRSSMDKDQLVVALREAGIETTGTLGTVEGFQEGPAYPSIPQTPSQFRQLQDNPDLPPERQSAPSPEQLNPQLFGPSAR